MTADKVRVRVLRNLTDMREGDTAWVDEGERVTGMVAGGFWEILERKAAPYVKARRPKVEPQPEPAGEVQDAAEDQAEPASDAGGDHASR